MNILTLILGIFALTSLLAAIAASFYTVSQKTIRETLEASNKAYADRNKQLEAELLRKDTEYATRLKNLEDKVKILERIKTPPLKPLLEMVANNHTEVMKAIGNVSNGK